MNLRQYLHVNVQGLRTRLIFICRARAWWFFPSHTLPTLSANPNATTCYVWDIAFFKCRDIFSPCRLSLSLWPPFSGEQNLPWADYSDSRLRPCFETWLIKASHILPPGSPVSNTTLSSRSHTFLPARWETSWGVASAFPTTVVCRSGEQNPAENEPWYRT